MKGIILGAGLYGEVYWHYLKNDSGVDIVGFLDDDSDKIEVNGIPIIGKLKEFKKLDDYGIKNVFCPIGENILRCELLAQAQKLEFSTPNYFHSSSIIASECHFGKGVYILPGTIIMPFVTIENFVMISMGAKVAHHTILENGVFISTGVNVGASIHIQENAFLGIGCTIMTGVKTIGKNSIIGAGAVVTKDVPDNAVMAGVPAKIIRYNL